MGHVWASTGNNGRCSCGITQQFKTKIDCAAVCLCSHSWNHFNSNFDVLKIVSDLFFSCIYTEHEELNGEAVLWVHETLPGLYMSFLDVKYPNL